MTKRDAINGKPYVGNSNVRFDKGEVASCTAEALLRRVHCRRQPEGCASVCAATPGRGSLLYNVKKELLMVFILLCVAVHNGAFADIATLKASDVGSASALLTADSWEGGTDIFPDPGVDYYVGGNKIIRTKSTEDITFGGRSLIIGNSVNNAYATLALRTDNDYGDRILQFTGEGGLELGRGSIENWNSCCTVVSGKVSVTSTSSRPFVFYSGTIPHSVHSERRVNCQLEGLLSSDENAKIFFYSTVAVEDIPNAYYRMLCDASGYLGMVEAKQASKGESTSLNRVTIELGECNFGGSLKMNRRTTVEPCILGSVAKIQNLELKAGSALSLRWDVASKKGAGLAVEGELAVEAPVEVRPSRFNSGYSDDGFSVPLLKAPLGMKLNSDDFVFIASQTEDVDKFLSPVVNLEVCQDADGRDVLWAKSLPVKRSSADDASGKTCSLCYDSNAPASNWPDGEVAKPEYDYVSAHSIRSLGSSAVESVFPGNSLTFKSSSVKFLALRCPTVVIPDLRIDLSGNSFTFDNYGGGDKTTNSAFATYGTMAVKGKLKLLSDSEKKNRLYVYPADKGLIRIDSDISGNGNIEVRLTGTNSKRCYMELAGDNSKWKGRLISSKVPQDDGAYSCILFRESKNLGGAMSSFTRNATHLGASGRLRPLQSATVSEPTRGIHVGGDHCCFEVNDGVIFTVLQRISYSGQLTKTGAGTLALGGGRPLFSDDENATSVAGKNILSIAEGSFTPLSSDAFDGVAVSFSEGTRIVLAVPDGFEDGVGRWGMALTNEYSSISLPENGIPVSLAAGTEPPSRRFTIPICTVRSAAAVALRGKFILQNRYPYPWHISEIDERNNGDGTVTFAVTTSRTGFVIGIR